MRKMTSRMGAAVALVAIGSLVLAACSAGGDEPEESSSGELSGTINIGQFGGALGNAITSIADDFTAKTGVKVTTEDTNPTELATAMIAGRNQAEGQYDLVMLSPPTHLQVSRAGIIEEIDESKVPTIADLPADMRPEGLYAPMGFFDIGIAYNTESLENAGVTPPTSWDDLWDPVYEGHVMTSPLPADATPQMLFDFLWDEEGSLEGAKDRFKELIPNLGVLVQSQPEATAAITAGDPAWVTLTSNSRAALIAADGVPIKFVHPDPGAGAWILSLDVPKNAPNKAAAYAFIDFLLQPEQQTKISARGTFTPANPKAKLDPSVVGLVDEPGDWPNLRQANWERIVDNLPEITDWWSTVINE